MARRAWWRLRTWMAGDRLDQELDEELAFHREMLERDFLQAGVTDHEARHRARRRLGNVTSVAEESRMHWGFPVLESLVNDARYAARSLRSNPSFTIAALSTLALGVGATVAIFTIVDAILLRPLPYPGGSTLVSLYASPRVEAGRIPLSYPEFRDVKAQAGVFTNAVFARGDALRVRGEMGAEALIVAFVSDGLFPMMGVAPLLGRVPSDGGGSTDDTERTIVLGHRMWMERFGGDPGIVNRRIDTFDGPYTVLGVMPPSFAWPEWAEAWSPLSAAPFPSVELERRGYRADARAIARVAPGVSLERVESGLRTIGARLAAEFPAENGALTIRALPFREELIGPVRRPLILLAGAVGGLLLIACANVGNLSLARASARMREVGVRLAIGASRARIARQLLVESTLLALAGGALGALLAYGAVRGLVQLAPPDLPRLAEVAIDGRVLLFTLGVCGASVLLFGLAPALAVSAANLVQAVKDGGRGSGSSRSRHRMQSVFVVAQVAIACTLVVGSGLLVKSFANMRGARPGFDTARLISLRLEPLTTRYETPAQRLALYNEIRDAVARDPGVERVSYINHSPASRSGVFTPLESDGDAQPGGRPPSAAFRLVDAGYFETMGQRVVRGRGFGLPDMTAHSTAVVVNATLARNLWGTRDPLGQRLVAFRQSTGPNVDQRIEGRVVGVVEDIKDYDLSADSWAEVYLPFPVNPWRSVYLSVRTKGDPERVIPAVQRIVRSIDRDLPVRRTATVDQLLGERLARRSFNAAIVTAFGIVALLLASFGIYGLVAYSVAQRTQEIGVRAALGARPAHLVRLFVGRATTLAAAGAVLGVATSVVVARAVQNMLFGVGPADATTLLQVSAATVLVAAIAAYFPARRALRVDPLTAMRAD